VPAVCGRLSNGLHRIDDFSHIAYCVGPFQLAFLLGSLQVSGILPERCMVFTFATIRGVSNDDLLRSLHMVCEHLGMRTSNASLLLSPTLKELHSYYSDAERNHHSVFWYCKGGLWPISALNYLRKALPDIVFEYYDGLGSHISELEQEKRRLSLKEACGFGDLRQLAVQRLMRPDGYFMPDDGLWQKYVPKEIQSRTHYIPPNVARDKIRLVGQMLDEVDGEKSLIDAPGVVLLTGAYSEWHKAVSLVDELNMYAGILEVIRSVSQTTPILVKTHPRTFPEKVQGLEDVCAKYNAVLYVRQQLAEYILEKSGRHDVVVIGTPSTALSSTIQLGYGRALCLNYHFIGSYLGHYNCNERSLTGVALLSETGVTVIDSLAELSESLREQVPR